MEELTKNLCGKRGRVRARVLVLDGDLTSAEATTAALAKRGCAARFALPFSTEHLRDMLSWQPELALLDMDQAQADCTEAITFLQHNGVATIVLTTDSRHHRQLWQADIVIDKGSHDGDLLPLLLALLERAGQSEAPRELPPRIDDDIRPTNLVMPDAERGRR